jgi:adenine-specific DNA-methyltransferase
VKAFRDTWELGIHSYLAYLRDRLVVARDLLTPSGSIFVQIGDVNVHLVRAVLDEVFGADNFVSEITFKKTTGAGSFAGGTLTLAAVSDYLLWYGKDRGQLKYRQLFREKSLDGAGGEQYSWSELPNGERVRGRGAGRPFRADNLTSQSSGAPQFFDVDLDGRTFKSGSSGWKTTVAGMDRLRVARRLIAVGSTLSYVRYIDDFPAFPLNNLWEDTVTSGFAEPKAYVVQTNTRVVERCLLMTTDPGDLVLDPTCGSGTTAVVAELHGRRWVTVDTSRIALALTRQRLMANKYPYFRMSDEEVKDIRRGFKYKIVPHVTLKSIANNPEIRDGLSREEIAEAVLRHADHEVLYDQPEIDSRIVRVTGPFTVESLSPHVAVPLGDGAGGTTENGGGTEGDTADRFQRTVVDHLRKAGVQNTVRSERLSFEAVEPWPGLFVRAVGDYLEGGRSKRAAISIGPEYGTVNGEFVREAAKEAAGVFDLVIVCGMAFDGYLDQELRKLGGVTVLKAAMNPDLAMGDDLLKKTGSGNLFMVFGEPDIDVRHSDDEVVVKIRGLDVYDPTTGEIRSHTTDDIACWFIDTDYNAESFFVRHAYFTGAKDPFDQLKRALRSDIDEEAWTSLYRTESRPFPPPRTGKIAVKVINHYGDEVMKVYAVGDPT